MTTESHDHAGAIDEDGYCELHRFTPVGAASTGNGTLAIVAPYYASALGSWWEDLLARGDDGMREFSRSNAHEVRLAQTTYSVMNPDGYEDSENAVLVNCHNGVYDVEARYCDEYGDGHMSICEVRIKLHLHDLDDEDGEE